MSYHPKDISNLIATTFRATQAKLDEQHANDLRESQARARQTHNAAAILPAEAESYIRHVKALTVARAQMIADAYTAFNQSSGEAGEKDLAHYYESVLSARRAAFQHQSELAHRRTGLSLNQLPGLLSSFGTESHSALLEGRSILAKQEAAVRNPQAVAKPISANAPPIGNGTGPRRSPGRPQHNEPAFETPFHTYVRAGRVLQGGAGIVFEVRDEEGRVFAIKRLDPNKVTQEKLKRFENELAFCKSQSHRNVIKPIDEGFTVVNGKKLPFYVMPFYPQTLRNLMADGIPQEKVLGYFAQILDGAEAAHHRKVWHRDLKPENILHDPETDTLIIADFGIAHFEEEELYTAIETKDGARLANFQYAAPEQRVRGREVTHRADIYALGLILNEMFTREILQGAGYKRIGTVAPPFGYLDDVVEIMVQQGSENRPDSIESLRRTLRARGDEYTTRQRLSALRATVIPASQVTDPLIDDPVRIVDTDYGNGRIVFTLSQPVNGVWTDAFYHQTVLQYWSGLSPGDFVFKGATADVRADERAASHALGHMNRYLQGATAGYKRKIEEARRKREEDDRRALQNQIDEEEKRQRILGKLKGKA